VTLAEIARMRRAGQANRLSPRESSTDGR